jgi:hypothetical protein
MKCELWRNDLIEHARERLPDAAAGKAALAHANACADCSLFLEEQRALSAAMKELAARPGEFPPRELESTLLAAFESHRRPTFESRRWRGRVWLKIAAVLVGAAALTWLAAGPQRPAPRQAVHVRSAAPPIAQAIAPIPRPVRKRAPRRAQRSRAAEPESRDSAPFLAIPYTAPLDPRERAMVVRMEMPVPALAAIGLAVAVPDPRASAQTDVLLGEDGRIRAIRLISISNDSNPDRRVMQ